MYIARRTGGGRGVYEIAGQTATGLTSGDLLDREIVFEFSPDLRLPSGIALHVQGGKHRLYMANAEIQVQRQIAAALMFPSPRRANEGIGVSEQVLRTKQYVIERIQMSFVNPDAAGRAYVVPDRIELRNGFAEQVVSVEERLDAITTLWAGAAQLEEPLRSLVAQHQQLVTASVPLNTECEQVVSRIQRAASVAWPEEVDVSGDPLQVLATHAGTVIGPLAPAVEPPVTTTGFEFAGGFELMAAVGIPDRVRREIIQRRGQRSFRQTLLQAYGAQCQVTAYTGEPALEAAHIFPYAEGGEFTNDPRNGLLLRADIHVLFDLGLVKVTPVSLAIRTMEPLADTSYAPLDGPILRIGTALRPSNEALAVKYEQAYG